MKSHDSLKACTYWLDSICEMMDKVSDEDKDMFVLGHLNLDYFSKNAHLRKKNFFSAANACNSDGDMK